MAKFTKKLLPFTLTIVLLGACSLLPKPAVETRYMLSPVTQDSSAAFAIPKVAKVLDVVRPQVPFELRSSKLALIKDKELTFYSDTAWSAPIPDMLQSALVRDLSAMVPGWIVTGTGNISRTVELQLEVHEFATIRDETGIYVVMNMDVQLIDPLKRTVVQRLPYRYRAKLSELSIAATMQAYNEGWQQLVRQVAAMVLVE